MSGVNLSAGNAPQAYDRGSEQTFRSAVSKALGQAYQPGTDLDMGKDLLILTSPDGSRWRISVSNAGALSATSI